MGQKISSLFDVKSQNFPTMARKVECAKCNYPEILFGRRLWVISFVLTFPIFVAMATGVGLM